MDWAYGWVVDSITVSGNEKTKPFVILREMEMRVGDVLNKGVLERDKRYLADLSIFANIEINADSIGFGRCALRIQVIERSEFFLKTLAPTINYDFDKDGFEYGVKWEDKNFRGRNEQLGLSYERDASDNDHVSFDWNAPWVGWRHIGLGFGFSYFHRADVPRSLAIVERSGWRASAAFPITASRISLAQVIGRLAMDQVRTGKEDGNGENQVFVSPQIGLRLDSRDSPLRPRHGRYFFASILVSRSVTGREQFFYQLFNDIRLFAPLTEKAVLAVQSNLFHQFDEFPGYFDVGLGGAGTVRGYADGKFIGSHRWYQSVEWRYTVLPRKVFRLPILGHVDVVLNIVLFIDGGIVWDRREEFQLERFHGGTGFGVRLYSPYQDVIRFDFGFNERGDVFPYLNTGIRF